MSNLIRNIRIKSKFINNIKVKNYISNIFLILEKNIKITKSL